MKKGIALLLVCLLVLSVSPQSANAEADTVSDEAAFCAYYVDTCQYDKVYSRFLPIPVGVDFFGNGGEFSIFELQNPIENCISLSVPAKITTDAPDFDYSATNWFFLVREQGTGVWHLCDDLKYEYRDGELAWACWESSTPCTIDAYTILPFNDVEPVPGFYIGFTITDMRIGFPDQDSARRFTEGLEKKTAGQSEQSARNEASAVNEELEKQRNGVFHIYRLHYDEAGQLDSWKGGTGFAVGTPGEPVRHIVTTVDNVISADSINDIKNYRIVVFSDGQYYDVEGIQTMLTGDPRLSLCILTMSESIRDCRPLILRSAETSTAGDHLFAFGFETERNGGFPDYYSSFPDDEALVTGAVLQTMNPSDVFGWLSTSLKYTEDFVGSPVFDHEGYVLGLCTSIDGAILSGDAIMKILEGSETAYTRLYDEE